MNKDEFLPNKPMGEFEYIMLLNIIKQYYNPRITVFRIIWVLSFLGALCSVCIYPSVLANFWPGMIGFFICIMFVAISNTKAMKLQNRKEAAIAFLSQATLSADIAAHKKLLYCAPLAKIFY